VLSVAARCARQLPAHRLEDTLPGRNRTYRALAHHIFTIPEVFLEGLAGTPITDEALNRPPPDSLASAEAVAAYGEDVARRVATWWARDGARDRARMLETYFGTRPLHPVLERTAWHSAQHTRQLVWALERMGITPAARLGEADLAGLPVPAAVWDG